MIKTSWLEVVGSIDRRIIFVFEAVFLQPEVSRSEVRSSDTIEYRNQNNIKLFKYKIQKNQITKSRILDIWISILVRGLVLVISHFDRPVLIASQRFFVWAKVG